MGVRMDEDEAWSFLAAGHTAILTTMRRDGWPVSLPVWYVVHDRLIHVSTPDRSKKIARIRNDERGCLLVERGERWTELAAVELPVRATVLASGAESERANSSLDRKYGAFRPPPNRMPTSTKRHYSSPAIVRLEPAGPLISWDNSRLGLRDSTD